MSSAYLSADGPFEFAAPSTMYRFSVDQYHRLIDAGILHDGDPVELIDGFVVRKMTKNPLHVSVAELIRDYLAPRIGPGRILRTESPVTLRESEPEPDVVVAHGARKDYFERHPSAAEVELLVEVSDSTLKYDLGDKKLMYAGEGVQLYWVVNLIDRRVEVFSRPEIAAGVADYADHANYGQGQTIPLMLGQQSLAVPVMEIIPALRLPTGDSAE